MSLVMLASVVVLVQGLAASLKREEATLDEECSLRTKNDLIVGAVAHCEAWVNNEQPWTAKMVESRHEV